MNHLCRFGIRLSVALTWCFIAAVHAQTPPPSSLVGVFSGASQQSAWYAGSDPVDHGFTGSQNSKLGSTVWAEELHRFIPDLTLDTGNATEAGVGFVGKWWTESGGLTAKGQSVLNGLISRMQNNPTAPGFVAHVLASAAYNEASPALLRTELAGYATALKNGVDTVFGAGNRQFDFYWVEAGNRWGNPEGGQAAAANRRRQVIDIDGRRDYIPSADPLPYFHTTSGVMSYVIGDWNKPDSGDGTHYTRADNQRTGRQLAYSMLLNLGQQPTTGGDNPVTITRELSVNVAYRDPDDPNAIFVKVLTNGGKLIAGSPATRISTASGTGIGVGDQGLSGSGWETPIIDNSTAAEGYSTVRLRYVSELPEEDLFFSHTWGTYHWIASRGSGPPYPDPPPDGPLFTWHEDLGWGNGMTQDFADLTGASRSIIMSLGSELLIPVLNEYSPPIPEPASIGLMGVLGVVLAVRRRR